VRVKSLSRSLSNHEKSRVSCWKLARVGRRDRRYRPAYCLNQGNSMIDDLNVCSRTYRIGTLLTLDLARA